MLFTSSFARTAILIVLTAAAAALMLVRVNASQQRGAAIPSSPEISLARHTPGSVAHERHEYRLRVAQATTTAGR